MMNTPPLRIGLIGYPGRMVQEIIRLVSLPMYSANYVISALITHQTAHSDVVNIAGKDIPIYHTQHWPTQSNTDVWIEFARESASLNSVQTCAQLKQPLLIATTGHKDVTLKEIYTYAQNIPLMHAPNTSLGIAVLKHLACVAKQLLGSVYDIEIVETHHQHKRDAPSGTAKSLAQALTDNTHTLVFDRANHQEARRPQEIGIASLRGGQVVGDHSIHFLGAFDRLELTHRAQERFLFAQGALKLAEFLQQQHNGLYQVEDYLHHINKTQDKP